MAADDQGFAAMDESQQKEIASKGGKVTGGKNLDEKARKKGGQHSRGGR